MCRRAEVTLQQRLKASSWKATLFPCKEYSDPNEPSESTTHHHATDELFVYETSSEIWERKLLKGDIPPPSSGGCGVILGDTLYFFGGVIKTDLDFDGNTNDFYALDLLSMTWTHLNPSGTPPIPCEKLVGWGHDGKVYFFGGFGPLPERHVFFQYIMDDETGCAWNNQFFSYNPQTNSWEWPFVNGQTPSPRAAHAGDKCGSQMFISGGRLKTVRKNDLYVLDMDTMTWSGNINESADRVPPGRSWHSFTFISPNRAVLYGGFSTYNNVLNDCWFVDISSIDECANEQDAQASRTSKWKVQYILPPYGQRFCLRRFWHKTLFFEDKGDLICFGGFNRFNNPPLIVVHGEDEDSVQDQDIKADHTNVMLTIHFKPLTLLRLSLNSTLKHHRRNRSLWSTLPHTLQTLLTRRFSQIYP